MVTVVTMKYILYLSGGGVMARRRIKKATEAEWRRIGEQAKLCRRELFKLMEMACPVLPVEVSDRLLRCVITGLDRFRSDAENEMFKRGGPESARIFYGE
jgi:hypothetical protein